MSEAINLLLPHHFRVKYYITKEMLAYKIKPFKVTHLA